MVYLTEWLKELCLYLSRNFVLYIKNVYFILQIASVIHTYVLPDRESVNKTVKIIQIALVNYAICIILTLLLIRS